MRGPALDSAGLFLYNYDGNSGKKSNEGYALWTITRSIRQCPRSIIKEAAFARH